MSVVEIALSEAGVLSGGAGPSVCPGR